MWKNELTLLRKENEAQILKLHGEDAEVITSIAKYLGVTKFGYFEIEMIKKELIGMALEARQTGKGLSEVLGKSEKEFCDELLQNEDHKNYWEFLLVLLKTIMKNLLLLAAVQTFFMFGGGRIEYNAISLTIMPGMVIAFSILDYTLAPKLTFCKWHNITIYAWFTNLCWVLGMVLATLLLFSGVLPQENYSVNGYLVLGFLGVTLLVLEFTYQKYVRGIADNYHWKTI